MFSERERERDGKSIFPLLIMKLTFTLCAFSKAFFDCHCRYAFEIDHRKLECNTFSRDVTRWQPVSTGVKLSASIWKILCNSLRYDSLGGSIKRGIVAHNAIDEACGPRYKISLMISLFVYSCRTLHANTNEPCIQLISIRHLIQYDNRSENAKTFERQ